MNLHSLPTPAALVDLDRLERNASSMSDRISGLGARLRPHVKTHKTAAAARIQTRGHFGGVTVSTLAEARFFADAGFDDITYAVPIPANRLAEAARLADRLRAFHVLVDHPNVVADVERFCADRGTRLSVFLKVDCGLHRSGVDPSAAESIGLAARLSGSPYVDFRGLLAHAGHAYSSSSRDDASRIAAEERDTTVRFAGRLRASGIKVPEVSIGSTPTITAVDHLRGVTEVRPGNYVFFDVFQSAIGSCQLDDVAFSVLATVIGVFNDRRQLVVDAGALALSKDPGPVHIDPGCGFGVVADPDDQRPIPELAVVSLSQEHGIIRSRKALNPDWRPGTRLRIFPNHSCLAAACFDRYHVLRGAEFVDEWRPVRGW